jgi:hypothetical protein
VAGTAVLPFASVSDVVVMLAGAIASLNLTVTALESATPVVPFAGVTLVTVGGLRSAFVVSKIASTK